MPRARKVNREERAQAPAKSLEARENQLVLLATNLAEKQLREGTASSQVIYHYLKLGTTREKLEQERLRNENELAKAKTDRIKSEKVAEELYWKAMEAFRSYSGQDTEEYDEGYDG